eukprot:scaffold22714_cov155-Cylindrotheca_fusiformis.AAC.5
MKQITMVRSTSAVLLTLVALLPHVQGGGGCYGGGCPANGGYAETCSEQQDCITWEVNLMESDDCQLGGRCPVQVCLVVDVSLPSCKCTPKFDRVCDSSDANGCPQKDYNNRPLFLSDGYNTGDITMCQIGTPGEWLAWVLQDGNDWNDEYQQMDSFKWNDDNPDCSATISCQNRKYKCKWSSCDEKYARTWLFKVPNDEGGSCDICSAPPTSGPTSFPSSSPTSIAPPPPSPISGSNGDPHFKTWKQEHFEYHGQCDLVLTRDPEFADGLGLDVHIRTKLVRFWSYVKSVAIRLGNDILEIEGAAEPEFGVTNYWINLEPVGELTTLGGFPVTHSIITRTKRKFEIDLSSKYPGQKIVVFAFKEFLRVDFDNGSAEAFGNTVGMLGNFTTGQTLARDGDTVMDDFTLFGSEWQVLPSENMMFHEISDPQFPKKCIEPEDPRGQRRRLDENGLQEEEAEKACAGISDPLDRKDCVYDVLATQDIDMAGAY